MTKNHSLRRDRRTVMRKNQILEAAAQVFAEKGFHRATTKNIAQTAQIAEGTIYNYFTNKDELLVALLSRVANLEWQQAILEESQAENVRTFFIKHLTRRIRSIKTNLKMFQAIIPEILSSPELREMYHHQFLQPTLEFLEGLLESFIERGLVRPVDVALTVRACTGMIGGFYLMIILGDPVAQSAWEKPEKLITDLADLIFEGLENKNSL